MTTRPQLGKIACPHCAALIKSPGLGTGAAVNCPKCGQAFRIGESGVGGRESERPVEGRKSKVESRENTPGVPQPPPPPVGSNPLPGDKRTDAERPGGRSHAERGNEERGNEERGNEERGNEERGSEERRSQNPKSAKPDVVVDPNLLPPPPPKPKEKPKEVAVVCRLCGTRVYAPLSKIGQTVKCPDCHTRNEVPGLKEETGDRRQGTGDRGQGTEKPTLDGTEEYGMSEIVERPKYRPLQAARGDYEVLSALDPAAMEYRLTLPGERPRSSGQGTGDRGPRTADEVDGEIALAPVEERPEAARDPRSILPQPEMEPENPLYDGRYENTVFGDRVDPRSPDAWKQAPLLYGIVEFVFYVSTLPRWLVSAGWLTAVACLGQFTVHWALQEGLSQGFGIIGIMFFAPLCGIWVVYFSATLLAIVQDTGNGNKEVNEWPGLNFVEWIANSAYVIIAGFLALLPGALLGGLVLIESPSQWEMGAYGIFAPPVLSFLVLFPLILFSMLAEVSVMAVYSPQTARSLATAAEAWVFFYMYSILLCVAAVLFLSLLFLNPIAAAGGAAGTTFVAFVYARLIGRVIWCASEKEIQVGRSQRSGVGSR